MRPKHIPQRKCISCNSRISQSDLVRIAVSSEGLLVIGTQSKKLGRGSYLCKSPDCWGAMIKGDRIAKTLRIPFRDQMREQLNEYFHSMSQQSLNS